MSFDDELNAIGRSGACDGERLGELARASLEEQREDDVLPLLKEAVRTSRDARVWQWKGLLERAIDEHGEALKSFAEAAALAPADASIAHGHARVALEAGVPAIDLFVRALRLAPSDSQVYIGLNAARIAEGKGEEAEAELERVLERSPLFLDGHHQLAQLRSLRGKRDLAFDSLERAIAANPRLPALWQALCELQVLGEEYELLSETLESARRAAVPSTSLHTYEFIAASERGDTAQADALLMRDDTAAIGPAWRIRHYLRTGRIELASELIDSELSSPRAADMWPYAETTWRMSGDPRVEWLAGDPNLVSVIDLSEGLAGIPDLADRLRSLHEVSGRYLNQSVRGGSQTDGPLFSRVEPEIRALRALVSAAVAKYAQGLRNLPEGHPTKASQSKTIRYSGSWSVRLVDGGFHANHVHPRGWISSALYVSLPQQLAEGEGWLTLGEPPADLGLDLPPSRMVPPKVGQLVLFPSWMFHGTRPFPAGERLTVAFDVAPPV
jgi:tetratricopeptide (TPR) repeat protein